MPKRSNIYKINDLAASTQVGVSVCSSTNRSGTIVCHYFVLQCPPLLVQFAAGHIVHGA